MFGQNVTVNSANASTATSNGALIVTTGGAGIAGNINVGGTRNLFTGAIGIGTSTAAGMIAAAGVSNDAYVWGNVRIANTATTSSGIVFSDGTRQTSAASPTAATVSFGAAGTIQFAGAGNTFLGDTANFFWDDTNNRLGIGTTTPGQTVSAYSAEAVLFNTRPGGAARQEITVGNVTAYGAVLGYDPSIGNSIGYLRRGDSAAGTPAITWAYGTGAYRVGVNGVTQPQNTMDISGTVAIGSGFSGLAAMTNTNGMSVQGSVGIGTFTPSTSANNLTLWSATGAGIQLASGGAAGGGNIQAITGSGLKFSSFTGGVGAEVYTERMRIDSNGDIGLGVADPLSTVDVGGIASFRGVVSVAGAATVASLTSNGAVSGTTGAFSTSLYSATFNTAGTATVAALVSNGAVSGASASFTAALPISSGGTGLITTPSNGQIDIGNGTGFTRAVLTQGTGVTITNGAGTITIAAAPGTVTSLTAGTGVTLTPSTITTTGSIAIGQAVATSSSPQFNALGIGVAASATAGTILATNEITAYSSDSRLKENVTPIANALEKVMSIRGVMFDWKDDTDKLGFTPAYKHDVGVIAQEIQAVLPEAIRPAPFDYDKDSESKSKSGEKYLTVQYEKLTALLIEAVKELEVRVAKLEGK